jgi:ArsR family transcriptional regulator
VAPATLEARHTAALADQLKALADSTRLRMLDLLAQQAAPLCVCDITAQFNQRQPTISHHLRILRDAGLIAWEKRGVWSYYWATETGERSLAMVRALL